METATPMRVSLTWNQKLALSLGEDVNFDFIHDSDGEEDINNSFSGDSDEEGAMDSSFPEGGANQQQAVLARLQASREQDRPPSQPQDLSPTRNASLHPGDELTHSRTSYNLAQARVVTESTDIDVLRPQQQQFLPVEDGDAVMLAVTGASQPSPFDHDRSHHAPSDGLFSPVQTAAADMEGAASTQPATPDAPAATTPPALPDLASGEGALPAADLNPNATAANTLPTLDAPISLAQPFDMGLGMDMSNTAPMHMDVNMDGLGMVPDFLPMDYQEQDLVSDERVNAFARLRFDDGSYYMHTYQIFLGRNLTLARKDMKRLQRVDTLEAAGDHAGAHALLHRKKHKRNGRGAPSVISEKGGIVSARLDTMPLEYQQRRQPSQSASSGSRQNGEAAEEKPAERAPQEVLMQTFPERPDQFDGHVPEDPDDCPLVPIHPEHVTARTGNAGPKGISRRHAKIFYNFDEGGFCIEVLGNNGLHHEDHFCPQGSVVSLEHGDRLSIGAVNIQFFLPDVALTEQQRLRQEPGSRPMSFSFENGNGEMESDEEMSSDSEGQMSINPRQVYYHPVDSDLDSEDDANDDLDEYQEPAPKQKIKLKLKAPRPREPSPRQPSPPLKLSKKQRLLEKKKKRKREERERRREQEEDDHSSFGSPVKKVKKIKPPQEEPVRASPTKESKAIKEAKQAKVKEIKDKEVEAAKEVKEPKEPKEPKEKGKAAAKAPSKTPVLDEGTPDTVTKETPVREQPAAPVKSVPNDSPPLLRKPLEAEIEAGGEIEGLITEEMARQHNLPASLVGHVVEKRKGPGRPPKDGIMSKRQRSQLIKQAKEIERAKAAGIDPADIPAPSIKPKITKRKESNAGEVDGDDILESTEQGDGTTMDRSKQKQPIKPPRTPSPEMRIEDYSEEQLQRPSANYVVLIHEAISSSPTGQMNLQQIYTYIEKKYPWYKFKTTTSGWQSSVRHNLGQHDAFVKGDKEGKGFNWRINPEVSIEKERRKRQNSPVVNHTQRPQYYPPPNGYPPYPPQPGYPYHPGMPPPGMPPAMPPAPRLPAGMTPRLPPSMARDANVATPTASQGAPPPSPYASPWAGGNTAGSPSAPMPPRPYPQPPHGAPPASSAAAGSSGQYGVLYPTSAPPAHNGHATPSPYGGPYASAGASPYAAAPNRPYAPYPPQGYPQSGHPTPPPQGPSPQHGPRAGPPSQSPAPPAQPPSQTQPGQAPAATPTIDLTPEIIARYPLNTDHGVMMSLEMFRKQYIKIRPEPAEVVKVDNTIMAFVDTSVSQDSLSKEEQRLWDSLMKVPNLIAYRDNATSGPSAPSGTAAGDAAVIAAVGAAGTISNASPSTHHQQIPQQAHQQAYQPTIQQIPQQDPTHAPPHASQQAPHQTNPTSASSPATTAPMAAVPTTPGAPAGEPHKFMPNMTVTSASAPSAPLAPVASMPPSHRPSVEPLTPVPGSPAVQTGTPLVKRSITEITAADLTAKEDNQAPEDDETPQQTE